SVDALRYQALPLEQVLDAAPLVKLCWYAHALVDNATPALLHAGRELLGLGLEQVQETLAGVQQQLDADCAALGIPNLDGGINESELTQEAQQKLRQLRTEIGSTNMLAQHDTAAPGVSTQLQLARALQDAGIDPVFIVLEAAADQVM